MKAARKPSALVVFKLPSPIEPLASDVVHASISAGIADGMQAVAALTASNKQTPKRLDDAITDASVLLSQAAALLVIAAHMTSEGQKLTLGGPDNFGRKNARRKARQRKVFP